MIVTCERCSARYRLDDAKVTHRGARITCPRCRHVFVVYPSRTERRAVEGGGGTAEATELAAPRRVSPTGVRAGSPPISADDLDFRKVGITSWKVKVRIGLVYDFGDLRTLRKYIQDGRVTAEDAISHDGQNWTIIGDIPDLDAYFVQVYQEAAARLEEARRSATEVAEDEPTTVVGMGSLGSALAAEFLRQGPSEGPVSSPPSTTTGGPRTDSGPFVDPFANLRGKQRERTVSRRRAPEPPATPRRGRGLLVAGIVLVVAVGAWGWWSTRHPPATPPTAPTAGPPPPAEEVSAEAIRKRLREEMAATLKEVEEERKREEKPQERVLIPVGPRDDAPGARQGRPQAPVVEAAGQQPSTWQDHLAAAEAAYQTGRWREAVRGYREAYRLHPEVATYLARYGKALYHAGDLEQALVVLHEAERRGIRDPDLPKYIGLILGQQGDVAGAVGYLNRYVDTSPPPRDADRIRDEIRRLTGG